MALFNKAKNVRPKKEILKPKPEYPEGVIPFDHRLSGKLMYLGECKVLSFKYHNGFLAKAFHPGP
jgi:hypothetical protein